MSDDGQAGEAPWYRRARQGAVVGLSLLAILLALELGQVIDLGVPLVMFAAAALAAAWTAGRAVRDRMRR